MATGRVPTTANSPLTAKGDLFGYSTTQARVAVGNDGETLVADSSTSTGLRYQAPVNANPVLNSAFQVWQRGTSFTGGTTTYGADRWLAYRNTTGSTFSRQVTGDTTNLPNIQYCIRAQRNSGNTATNSLDTTQIFESVNTIPYAGKTVTLSFYARAGANYSATSNLLYAQVFTGTGTDQNVYSGYTGQVTALNQANTLTTTWQRFTATFSIGATATEMSMLFVGVPTGTAGTNDYYELTGVQLEVGSVATPFKTYAGTIQGELSACQRYFQKSYGQGVAPATAATTSGLVFLNNAAQNVLNTDAYGYIKLPVVMRSAPTVTTYSYTSGTATAASSGNGTDLAANSAATTWVSDDGFNLFNNSGGTINQAGGGFAVHYIASAEL